MSGVGAEGEEQADSTPTAEPKTGLHPTDLRSHPDPSGNQESESQPTAPPMRPKLRKNKGQEKRHCHPIISISVTEIK